MEKIIIVVVFMICTASTKPVSAQTQSDQLSGKTFPSKSTKMSIGFHLNQLQSDFGLGINVTSPFFAHKSIAVRISGSYRWLQNIPLTSSESTWSEYNNFRLGIVGVTGIVANNIRLYGEGGLVIINPNREFSNTKVLGGYGLFGFDFFMKEGLNYYIELGGIGTGAVAQKSVGSPQYSNGFLVSTGIRTYF